VVLAFAVAAWTCACDDNVTKAVATEAAAPPAPAASATAVAPATSASAAPPAAEPSPAAAAPDAIAAQHVLIAYKGAQKAPKGVTRTKAEAQKRAEEVAAKAKSGTDFSALVAEYSDDPAAKERQGSLGKFTREKMAKPFSDAAFELKVDAISAPVETPFGFHVIKRNQ
jgi:peptidyl-prolyl cis-trans isomerase NIMA-interacting 1